MQNLHESLSFGILQLDTNFIGNLESTPIPCFLFLHGSPRQHLLLVMYSCAIDSYILNTSFCFFPLLFQFSVLTPHSYSFFVFSHILVICIPMFQTGHRFSYLVQMGLQPYMCPSMVCWHVRPICHLHASALSHLSPISLPPRSRAVQRRCCVTLDPHGWLRPQPCRAPCPVSTYGQASSWLR